MVILEAVVKVVLVVKLLQNKKISVKLQVMVRLDNKGVIFMAGNVIATSQAH